jgi:hypothetical protein
VPVSRACACGVGETDPKLFESLRLAAKAADRGRAAEELCPAFESRLRGLGYSGRAIAHAYRTLTGPGTVSEALEDLHRPSGELGG